MPEKPLTVAGYAAGASLAAVTLIYVFGPTFFLDDEAAESSRSSRKMRVVGLSNPANDCFINSVLQALAGLPELRVYLIRELHRRALDGPQMYQDLTAALQEQKEKGGNTLPEWQLLGLQQGLVTAGLKDILDALNERPIYKKTISAQAFIKAVEHAYRTRISRTQQDAQELLQVVAERLADEYYAGRRVRKRARWEPAQAGRAESGKMEKAARSESKSAPTEEPNEGENGQVLNGTAVRAGAAGIQVDNNGDELEDWEEDVIPFEGKMESQVECTHCGFKPKPHVSSFVTITLHVPQNSGSTTLNACFDGMLKVEHIDDFTCDQCRLDHALQVNARQLSRTDVNAEERARLEHDKEKLAHALQEDPESPPTDVKLPESSTVPKRRIKRHMRISSFPRVLAIHLSRSVWDSYASSSKNNAKVSFPETLPLGGLLDRQQFRLHGLVTHKGGHNSGHYESFRRQYLNPPFSTPTSMGTEGIYSVRATPAPSAQQSAAPSPRLSARQSKDLRAVESNPSTPSLDSPSTSSLSSHSVQQSPRRQPPTSIPFEAVPAPGLPTPPKKQPQPEQVLEPATTKGQASLTGAMNKVRRKRGPDRWWRISDEKIKESKTSDVLGMQREVYLLFYEMVGEGGHK